MSTPPNRQAGQGEVVCVMRDAEGDERALRVAVDLGERLGLALALIGVRAPVVPPASAATVGGPYAIPPEVFVPAGDAADTVDDTTERRKRLARLVEPAGVPARVDAVVGSAGDVAGRLAASPRTAWLVLADDGAGPVMGRLEGEPARGILRDAPCPVVVVPPGSPSRIAQRPSIVCGVPEGPDATAVAAAGGELAVSLGGRLRCVHVLGLPVVVPPVRANLDGLEGPERERVERLFAACRAALAPQVPVTFECLVGDPRSALRAAAAEEGAALLVVGRPSHGALVSALVGSVTHDVLASGHVPVVIAPPSGDAPPPA